MGYVEMKKIGVYIHVPFCNSRCIYCGFYSNAIEGVAGNEKNTLFENYFSEVQRGIISIREEIAKNYKDYEIDSVFFGGGTPSILPLKFIEKLLNEVAGFGLKISEACEITIEANPNNLDYHRLIKYREMGINRLSIGVQSLNDDELAFLGRTHKKKDVYLAYETARRAGFDNINLDLIFAIPGQDIESWNANVGKICELDPEHISIYSLEYEEGTRLSELLRNEFIFPQNDDIDRKMYWSAVECLEKHSYIQYEISNFAKQNKFCLQNKKYWDLSPYIGIGRGAHGFISNVRYEFANLIDIPAANMNGFFDSQLAKEDLWELATDYVFVALRRNKGIDFDEFKQRIGQDFFHVFSDKKKITDLVKMTLLKYTDNGIALTKKGVDLANSVISTIISR